MIILFRISCLSNFSLTEMMAELGISDVSEVSDPQMSDDDDPRPLRPASFLSAANKKKANFSDDEPSDWGDSTQVEPSFFLGLNFRCITVQNLMYSCMYQ